MKRLASIHVRCPGSSLAVARRGFSLIELLVAIIILGLGLLGLAALFPVVIREQRIGTDNVLGVTVSNSARAKLGSTQWERGCAEWSPTAPEALPSSWSMLRDSPFGLAQGARSNGPGEAPAGPGQQWELGEWWIPEITDSFGVWSVGTTLIGDPRINNRRCGVPLAARLYPGEGDPQMVWDFAVQRISDFDFSTGPLSDRLRAAIFVRRVDPRIRTGSYSLREVLLDPNGTLPFADRRFPVGADNDNVPTLDGTNGSNGLRYANLMVARFRTDFQIRVGQAGADINRLTGVNLTTPVGRLMAQLGQKFVDNLGNIYTVVEIERPTTGGDLVALRISPGLPAAALRQPAGVSGRTNLQQLLFSPQVPAAVVLTEITP